MCPLTYLPSLLTGILLPRLNWLFSSKFLIVVLVSDYEILRGCFSPCELSRMLLLVSIADSMSEQCLVEYRWVYCFKFP